MVSVVLQPHQHRDGQNPLQAVLEVPEFHDLIGQDERRALTPLFWSNINPYGRFRLDMDARLDLSAEGPAPAVRESVL